VQLNKREAKRIIDKLQIEHRNKKHNYGFLKYNMGDFEDLKNCPLSRDGYIKILKSKGLIDKE